MPAVQPAAGSQGEGSMIIELSAEELERILMWYTVADNESYADAGCAKLACRLKAEKEKAEA
jgi:hypothetical protein